MAGEDEYLGVRNFVPVLLSPLSLFSVRRDLEELEQHYAKIENAEHLAELWNKIIAGKTIFTLDLFFAALEVQNLNNPETRKEFLRLVRKNQSLCNAILAELGDSEAQEAFEDSRLDIIRSTNVATNFVAGFKLLRGKLADDQHFVANFLRIPKITRRLRAMNPEKLGAELSIAIATNQRLWEQISRKGWFESKKHFLARRAALAKNSVFAKKLVPENTNITADELRKLLHEQVAVVPVCAASATQVTRFFAARDAANKENMMVISAMTEEVVIDVNLEEFRKKRAVGYKPGELLYTVYQAASYIDIAEARLREPSLSKFSAFGSEADMQELSRGGAYYCIAVGLPEREEEPTLTKLRDSLQNQKCTDEEIEDVLRLIMQNREGIPSSLGGSLNEIGRCFIDAAQFDSAGAGVKMPRIWKEGNKVHIYLESRMVEDKRDAGSRCLFNYILHLTYVVATKSLKVERATVRITDPQFTKDAHTQLAVHGLVNSKRKLGVSHFKLEPSACITDKGQDVSCLSHHNPLSLIIK